MTWLTFCQHIPRRTINSEFADDHESVLCARRDRGVSDDNASLPCLKGYIGSDEAGSFEPAPNDWLNVREIWNVDFRLAVAVLSEAEPESFKIFLKHVQHVFCSTLGDPDTLQRSRNQRQRNELALASSPEDDGGRAEVRETVQYQHNHGLFGSTSTKRIERRPGKSGRSLG